VKVMRLNDSLEQLALVEEEVPQPEPGRGEVLMEPWQSTQSRSRYRWPQSRPV
jgi:hypothetical protein